jgi:hypothetical protein
MTAYPEPQDYTRSVKNLSKLVHDDVLRHGQVCITSTGELLTFCGGYAFVAKIRGRDGKHYAMRCWTRAIGDAGRHYQEIADFLASNPMRHFEECVFTSLGITVGGVRYPIVRMRWFETVSLREFIADVLAQGDDSMRQITLEQAADGFMRMAAALHRAGISHGDLQADNIKVERHSNDFEFKLIDYDTLCLPGRSGRAVTNGGLPSYQHHHRDRSKLTTAKDDYFPELVIHLSLRALARAPELWDEFDCERRDTELLFAAEDFKAAADGEPPTPIFRRLYEMGAIDTHIRGLAVVLWNFACCPDIGLLQPVEAIVSLVEASGAPRHFQDIFKAGHNRSASNGSANGGWLDEKAFHAPTIPTAPRPPAPTSHTPPGFTTAATRATPAPTPTGHATFAQLIGQHSRPGSPPAVSPQPPPKTTPTIPVILSPPPRRAYPRRQKASTPLSPVPSPSSPKVPWPRKIEIIRNILFWVFLISIVYGIITRCSR